MDVKLYDVPNLKKVNETMASIKTDILQASKLLKQTNISILDLLHTRIGEVNKRIVQIKFELIKKIL